MKNIIVGSIATALAIVSTFALADAIAPNSILFTGSQANNAYNKIVEITGQTPVRNFRGHNIVNATAQISCVENGACTVTIAQ